MVIPLSSSHAVSNSYHPSFKISTMVIPLSSSHAVNMRIISKALVFSISALVLLSSTTYSVISVPKNPIKSYAFVSQNFEIAPGIVGAKSLLDIDFPRGHIGVKSFDAELVDEEGKPVPLHETYLHHWFAIRYFEKMNLSNNTKDQRKNPFKGMIFKRNEGICNGYILPHYWGFGSESRGTTSKIPDPFAIELGNPAYVPPGYKEKWLFSLMAIDTRGAEDKEGCTQCRCDHFNLPKDFYDHIVGIDNKPLSPDYKGGIFCCVDNLQCKLKEGFQGPNRKLSLRYNITWVEWDRNQVPVKVYLLDSTDEVKRNGSKIIHNCQVEYTIPENFNGDYHVQKSNIPIEKGSYLIYGTAHMHTGVVNATLYGQDGRALCTSTPKYGTGKEPRNESGYVVAMSTCYPVPGSIKINDGEVLTVESRYKSGFRTGVMGQFFIYLAEQLP